MFAIITLVVADVADPVQKNNVPLPVINLKIVAQSRLETEVESGYNQNAIENTFLLAKLGAIKLIKEVSAPVGSKHLPIFPLLFQFIVVEPAVGCTPSIP